MKTLEKRIAEIRIELGDEREYRLAIRAEDATDWQVMQSKLTTEQLHNELSRLLKEVTPCGQ